MSSIAVELSAQCGRWVRRLPPISLRSLRWLSAILPAALLIATDYARHFVFPFALHDALGFSVLWLAGLLGAITFSWLVFGTIERMQREIVQRNDELSLLYDAAHRQAEQLGALRQAGMALTAELSLETVLQKVVDLSRELVGARYGSLAVLDDDRRIEKLITSGLSAEARARITEFPKGIGVMSVVPDDVRPVRMPDIGKHPMSVGFPPNHPKMTTLLGVPIVAKGQVIGNLKLTNKLDGREFTQEDEDRVVMLAAQAAIAIENAKLHEQEQVVAVLQERERIAQDLHDGIIQDIYAIGLNLEHCREQVGDRAPEVTSRLARAVEGLDGIIKDVRNYIFALQPTSLEGSDLAAGLETLGREFKVNSLVDLEVVVSDEVDGLLSPEQLGHVFQITREALTNILKHSRATAATVEICRVEHGLELGVADNGRGFSAKTAYPAGRGLRNMAERARSLGGSLRIESEPGIGSKLTFGIPLAYRELGEQEAARRSSRTLSAALEQGG